ncbi:N-succinyl-L-ornithine transcarbamylase [Pustulibacterium marinum]|uniref:N-succinylornithine carbamoyltransferase n=1 Tax=Pustulibacterium marinum TaxID=1224947 RepID=A0A1I7FNY1_9FLAO|nr:N-acetylornithine carbamoyltransferase [Pustulibacterium marinum]SFU37894.1 N-succinyl-L-ornithine transcarbamylase [Pustulibacterium marinum]
MKQYLDVTDIENLPKLIDEAIALKKNPFAFETLGKHKTIGLLFFNSSLRTRLSTQKAAMQLGMHCMVMNFTSEAWTIEFEDGTVMDGGTSEHIKEAAAVVSQYCDIIAVRAFPTLTDKEKDQSEFVLNNFKKYASVPIINMESATAHPLQALADAITIMELKQTQKPKVVLSWAPHPKALPHAVANSFTKMMQKMDVDFVITHPEGYELDPEVTKKTPIMHNQKEAFKDADFIYVKNWSNFKDYGKVLNQDKSWTITNEQMSVTNNGKFMHCLPVRRNMIVADEVLDSEQSIVIQQANNRTFSAQVVLKNILEELEK